MERPTPQQPKKYLPLKRPALMITNACNMMCGACLQFCGQFEKHQIFFISIDQFKQAMDSLTIWREFLMKTYGHCPPISIYGGEPTIHPKWDELLEIMWKNEHLAFTVFTNGLWLTNGDPCLSDIYDLETKEFVNSFIKVDLSEEDLYYGRVGFKNMLQTKLETEVLAEEVNKQKFECECGHFEYEFVAYHEEFRPKAYIDHKYRTYYRCKSCGQTYRWDQARAVDGISGKRCVSKSLQDKLERLPYEPLPQHVEAFKWDAIQSVVKNVAYRIDSKTRNEVRWAAPIPMAPVDYVRGSKKFFWNEARQNCPLWKKCESTIYDGKAYFCLVAGAMDKLFYDGKYGWPIEEGKNPFLRTRKEIDEQAEQFCYRCGYSCKVIESIQEAGEKQMVFSETLTSPTNYPYLKRARLAKNPKWIPYL